MFSVCSSEQGTRSTADPESYVCGRAGLIVRADKQARAQRELAPVGDGNAVAMSRAAGFASWLFSGGCGQTTGMHRHLFSR